MTLRVKMVKHYSKSHELNSNGKLALRDRCWLWSEVNHLGWCSLPCMIWATAPSRACNPTLCLSRLF